MSVSNPKIFQTFVVQTGIKHILAGMKAHSVSRLIQISSWGTHPEPYDSYFFTYFVTWRKSLASLSLKVFNFY